MFMQSHLREDVDLGGATSFSPPSFTPIILLDQAPPHTHAMSVATSRLARTILSSEDGI